MVDVDLYAPVIAKSIVERVSPTILWTLAVVVAVVREDLGFLLCLTIWRPL